MQLNDTIVAPASGAGFSPRAIVRVAGPRVAEVSARFLGGLTPSRKVMPARFVFEDASSLPMLALRFAAPGSYTGDELLELFLPGNPHLAERIVSHVLQVPETRRAEPGEFTARAYLRGKLSLEQAESVAAMIGARSAAELEAGQRLARGETGARYRSIADELTTLLALVEAGIDFTDQEDVVPISPANLAKRIDGLLGEMRDLGGHESAVARMALPRVMLAGKPNAGKSTLFNALLRCQRAIVSPVAGTTRDALIETLDLSHDVMGAGEVELADLAGIDEGSSGDIDVMAQEKAREAIAGADVVVWCDPSGKFQGSMPTRGRIMRVMTKADQGTKSDSSDAASVCALDGFGIAALRRAIADAASGGQEFAVVPRHRASLREASRSLQASLDAIDVGKKQLRDPELVAESMRAALDCMGELIGHVSPDDVLGRIFRTFCVGK